MTVQPFKNYNIDSPSLSPKDRQVNFLIILLNDGQIHDNYSQEDINDILRIITSP